MLLTAMMSEAQYREQTVIPMTIPENTTDYAGLHAGSPYNADRRRHPRLSHAAGNLPD